MYRLSLLQPAFSPISNHIFIAHPYIYIHIHFQYFTSTSTSPHYKLPTVLTITMKMKPLVVLGLSAAAGVVPGKPAAKPADSSNNAQIQQPQQPINTQAQGQEAINQATHERLFGGNCFVTNAQGGQDWVGPRVG
jgi:hypothetical protein